MSDRESNPNTASRPRHRIRRWAWFMALLVTGGGFVWLSGGFDREPIYQGKPASYWLDIEPEDLGFEAAVYPWKADGHAVWVVRQARDGSFRAMGGQGVSFLIRTLRRKPSRALINAVDFIDEHHIPAGAWIERHIRESEDVEGDRWTAVETIIDLGPAAASAVPALARVFGDTNEETELREMAGQALENIGGPASAALRQLVEVLKIDNGDNFQILSAEILGKLGPKAAEAIPALRVAVQTKQRDKLKLAAGVALWKIDRETNLLIQVCSTVLNGTEPDLRCQALASLKPLGAAASTLCPTLQSAITNGSDGVRWEAQKLLRQIDPEGLRAILSQINQDLPDHVSRIALALASTDIEDVSGALRAVAVLGPQAAAAAPCLIELLAATNRPEENGAPGSIGLRLRDSPATGWDLTPSWLMATELARAVAEIGPEARGAVPQLIALPHRPWRFNHACVCKALGGIGPDAREVLPVLESFLVFSDPAIQLAAAEAISRISPEPSSKAVLVLRQVIQNEPLSTWYPPPVGRKARAMTALWRWKLEPKPPVEAILKEWEEISVDPAIAPRRLLIDLLGEIGPEAKSALPLLKDCLDQDVELGRAAAIAIRKIDPDEYTRLGFPGVLAIP